VKVTDAVLAKFVHALEQAEIESPWMDSEPILRNVLEFVLEDERAPLHADDVWQMKLDAAERDRESILRRYRVLAAKLDKVREWQRSEAIEASAFDRLYAILDKEDG
jgi:hypothetical protein